jgi:hypothetical protein
MVKVVINRCYGGFGLSPMAEIAYKDRAGVTDENWSYYEIIRDDPILVHLVEELLEDANGSYSELKIVEVPENVEWYVEEYDGMEWVAEKHRTWM